MEILWYFQVFVMIYMIIRGVVWGLGMEKKDKLTPLSVVIATVIVTVVITLSWVWPFFTLAMVGSIVGEISTIPIVLVEKLSVWRKAKMMTSRISNIKPWFLWFWSGVFVLLGAHDVGHWIVGGILSIVH